MAGLCDWHCIRVQLKHPITNVHSTTPPNVTIHLLPYQTCRERHGSSDAALLLHRRDWARCERGRQWQGPEAHSLTPDEALQCRALD